MLGINTVSGCVANSSLIKIILSLSLPIIGSERMQSRILKFFSKTRQHEIKLDLCTKSGGVLGSRLPEWDIGRHVSRKQSGAAQAAV